MGGRFFSPVILSAVFLLLKNFPTHLEPKFLMLAGVTAAVGFLSPFSPIWSNSLYQNNIDKSDLVDSYLIADERGFYFQDMGLVNARKYPEWPDCSIRLYRLRTNENYAYEASTIIQIGLAGFCAGPSVRIIDQMALADPLLSHLPPRFNPYWRPGHLARIIPEGYKETVQSGENHLDDPNLAIYYDKIKEITQGNIWNAARFKTILAMNLGRYDNLINEQIYRYPTLQFIHEVDANDVISEGTSLDDQQLKVLSRDGIQVILEERSFSTSMQLGIDNINIYQIRYQLGNQEIKRTVLHRAVFPGSGIAIVNLSVPREVSRKGFDRVWIIPIQNARGFSFNQPFSLNSQDHPELDSARFGFLVIN